MEPPVQWPIVAGSPPSSREAGERYRSVKLIVIVTTTGTGAPFSSVGVNFHCFTASSAA